MRIIIIIFFFNRKIYTNAGIRLINYYRKKEKRSDRITERLDNGIIDYQRISITGWPDNERVYSLGGH